MSSLFCSIVFSLNWNFFKAKKTILFTIALERGKYLRINVAKKVKDLHNKNYETVLK